MSYKSKSQRKLFATSLTAAMVASAVAPVAVSASTDSNFPDLPDGYQFNEAINALVAEGVINGYPDGEFHPTASINRGQAAVMLTKALKLDTDVAAADFPDVDQEAWYAEYVNALVASGDINGYPDGTFGPLDNINRAQIAVLLVNAYDIPQKSADTTFEDVDGDAWYTEAIETLYAHGLISGTNEEGTEFSPMEDMRRDHFAWLLYNVEKEFGSLFDEEAPEVTVSSATVIDEDTISVTFSDGETMEYDLDEVLVDGENEVTVEYKGEMYTVTVDFDAPDNPGDDGDDPDVEADTAIQGFVNPFATVKVGDEEVVADKNGYYSIPATPGLVEIEVSKEGYFTKTEEVNVTRNHKTAENISLELVDLDELAIEGNIVDDKTGESVKGAMVTLQEKNGDEWLTLDTVTTKADGKYGFYNSEASASDERAALEFDNALNKRMNEISTDSEYRVVVSKDLSSSNLDDVYHETTTEFTSSDDEALTTVGTEFTPVEEIESMKLAGEWNTQNGSVELLDVDGSTILASLDDLNLDSEEENGKYKADVNLVKAFGQDVVTLPTGTYFLRINDANAATEIVAVEVTEGNNTASSVSLEEAQEVQATSTFTSFPSDSMGETFAGSLNVYKEVNGVEVLVDTLNDGKLEYKKDSNALVASYNFDTAETTDYKFEVSGDYILEPVSETVSVVKGKTTSPSLEVDPAGTASANVELLDNDGNALDLSEGTEVPVTAELVNADGETVDSVTYSELDKYDNSNEDTMDPMNSPFFDSVEPGKYMIKVSAPGFESNTSEEFEVVEFTGQSPADFGIKADPEVTVEGYVRYDGDLENEEVEGEVFVYQGNNLVTVDEVEFNGETNKGTYVIGDDENLEEGSYTFVVRGPGFFETVTDTITANKGEQTLNFAVEGGSQAIANLTLVDTLGNKVDGEDVTVSVTDKWDDPLNSSDDYTVENPKDGSFITPAELSAGTYEVTVLGDDDVYEDTSFGLEVGKNETVYERITIQNSTNDLLFNVTGSVAGVDSTTDVVVAAIDENGYVVDYSMTVEGSYSLDVPNGNYEVAVFADGTYVGDQEVSVEDTDLDNINFSLTSTSR
ncbi:S-layer homology domain-containing protein [Halobacillus faecis]